MPPIQAMHAITYPFETHTDLSSVIAPPYDVLSESKKAALMAKSKHNIVAVDLPHLPPKTVGPDEAYQRAGERFRQWLSDRVMVKHETPTLFVYAQRYTVGDKTFCRRGLIGNVRIQEFGAGPEGQGGIWPHEQTFSAAKEDRLKLMRATQAQLSPIFGIFSDPQEEVGGLLQAVMDRGAYSAFGVTDDDGVRHEIWAVTDPDTIRGFEQVLGPKDIYIADGHHRYNTALIYRREQVEHHGLAPENTGAHPADWCQFVLVSMQDPGMIVLPTHRVLGNMPGFDIDKFKQAAAGKLNVEAFTGDSLEALEAALPDAGPHAMGLYDPANPKHPFYIATTLSDDPLAQSHALQAEPWRKLDVAILQHLVVEQVCEPTFCGGDDKVGWKFPHEIAELKRLADSEDYQLGVVMQPTPLESIRQVSEAGELMPQKSTFFYPKLATGLAVNPIG